MFGNFIERIRWFRKAVLYKPQGHLKKSVLPSIHSSLEYAGVNESISHSHSEGVIQNVSLITTRRVSKRTRWPDFFFLLFWRWQHQEVLASLVMWFTFLTPCSHVFNAMCVCVCVYPVCVHLPCASVYLSTRRGGKQDVTCITRWTLDKGTSFERVCAAGWWVCAELPVDLSGLLTLPLHENNAECSRKSNGICTLTAASYSRMTRIEYKQKKPQTHRRLIFIWTAGKKII